MPVIVAVVTKTGASLATDSLSVDPADSSYRAAGLKRVRVGKRAAAIASECYTDEIAGTLTDALALADSFEDIWREFIVRAGATLDAGFTAWRETVGPHAAARRFFEVILVSNEGEQPKVQSWYVRDDGQSMFLQPGDVLVPRDQALVFSAGSFDDALHAHTQDGRMMRQYDIRYHYKSSYPDVPPISLDLVQSDRETYARFLIQGCLARYAQNRDSGPKWWPAGVPVVDGPVAVVSV